MATPHPLAGIWAATAIMDLRYRPQVPYDASLPLVAGLRDTPGRGVRTCSLHLLSGEAAPRRPSLLVTLPRSSPLAPLLYGPVA
jgi:hypothetical protein